MSQEGPSLRSEEYSCRTAHQILGPQGETSCEEDIVPVCDMQEVGGYYIYPTTASLPEFRVNLATPFSRVGVDFAGPMYVKGRAKQLKKVYVCLFSCCVTRALPLDLVEDLSTPTFLRCLRKFTAQRGTPALIVSDNAKTFKGAEKEICTLFRHPEVRAELDNEGIECVLT